MFKFNCIFIVNHLQYYYKCNKIMQSNVDIDRIMEKNGKSSQWIPKKYCQSCNIIIHNRIHWTELFNFRSIKWI